MKRLVAGPWVGEFGWELMSWQGLVRKAASGYDEVWVCGPPGHEALYSDFRPQYIPCDPPGVRDCWKINVEGKFGLHPTLDMLKKLGGDQIAPYGLIQTDRQTFIKYGDPARLSLNDKCDIIIHARMAIGKRPWHSWPRASWDQLIDLLVSSGFTVGAVGTLAFVPDKCKNFTNQPLQLTMDLMSAARLVVGPSSGPMHLASLCGTPHLAWTDKRVYSAIGTTNRERYEKVWNPLNTRAIVLDQDGWQPSPISVFTAVSAELKHA